MTPMVEKNSRSDVHVLDCFLNQNTSFCVYHGHYSIILCSIVTGFPIQVLKLWKDVVLAHLQ